MTARQQRTDDEGVAERTRSTQLSNTPTAVAVVTYQFGRQINSLARVVTIAPCNLLLLYSEHKLWSIDLHRKIIPSHGCVLAEIEC
jgi:hypothetical protein